MNTVTHLLQGLDGLGKWLVHTGGWLSLELLILAGLIFGVLKVTRLRSARARQWLWTLVLVKPLIALLIAWPFGVGVRQPMTNRASRLVEQASLPVMSGKMPDPPEYNSLDKNIEANIAPTLTALQGESTVARSPAPGSQTRYEVAPKFTLAEPSQQSAIDSHLSGYGAVAGLWLMGAVCLSLYTAMGLVWLLRLHHRSTLLESGPLDAALRKCLAQLKLPQPVGVRVSDQIKSPLVFGFWRSNVLLPRWCVDQLKPQEIELMLLHELSHLRTFDHWLVWLKRLSEVIFWFHPAIWYAGRRVVDEAEQACDDAVVVLSARPKRYASCLVRMLEQISKPWPRYTFAGLAPGTSPTGKRVRRLLDGARDISTRISKRVFFGILVLGIVSLPSLFCAKAQPELKTIDSGQTAAMSSESVDEAADRGHTADVVSELLQKEVQKQQKQKQKRSGTMTARDSALIEKLRGLGFGDPATIPRDELVSLLFEIDRMNTAEGREAALESLGLTGDPGAEVLISIYDDSSEVKAKKIVLTSLAFIGDSLKGIEKLDAVARTEKNPELCKRAIQALAMTGSDAGAEKLIALYDDSDDVQAKEEIIEVMLITSSAKAIEKLDSVAREEQDPKLRKKAIEILALKGDEGAERLLPLYDDTDDAQIKEQIIQVMLTNGSREMVEKLGVIAREEQDPKLRKKAIEILALKGNEGAERLIPLYDDTDDAEVKRQIIQVMLTNGSREMVEKLGVIAREEQDPKLRKKAIEILALKGNEGAEKLIPLYDEIDDVQVKEQILEVMLLNNSPKVVEKLESIVQSEKDPRLRKAAIKTLGLKY